MGQILFRIVLAIALLAASLARADSAPHDRADVLALAQRGWVFDFRSSLFRRDPDLPPVRFDARTTARGSICIFGETPHPLSREVIGAFEALLVDLFARSAPIIFAGRGIADCPARQRIYLRLYSGAPPAGDFNRDLRELDRAFGIGLPRDRPERISSPAQAIGFFGRRGDTAHMLVRQPPPGATGPLERTFHISILLEELFQVVSWGVDILKFDREARFMSKLQEYPTNLRHLSWEAPDYMRALLASNPNALCPFDIFMLHALAASDLDTVNTPALLGHLEAGFDALKARAEATVADPRFAILIDGSCARLPP